MNTQKRKITTEEARARGEKSSRCRQMPNYNDDEKNNFFYIEKF
jgi:hypothetical protein